MAFDAPLAPHHRLLGRWIAATEGSSERMTRPQARRHIEQVFDHTVLEILAPCKLADLRVVVLHGEENPAPAIAIICDSVGQLDLGWIEKSNVLSDTLFGTVAPVGWRAAAYQALAETLNGALPVFGYAELFEEISMYYWDGATDDAAARDGLIQWHGADPAEVDELTLPSQMNARRPDWMLAELADPLKRLPRGLANRIRRLRTARKALLARSGTGGAWDFDFNKIVEYIPAFEDCSHLPPLTLVSFDDFATELDTVAQHGMETGFMDIAGLCPLRDADEVDAWLASLRLGAELLLAAQELIDVDPVGDGRL